MSQNESLTAMQRERMRLAQVRKSFMAGVEQQSTGQNIAPEFLLTCVDYIKAAMDRLHAQDQRIHDLLIPHVAATDTVGADTLAHLNHRLAKSREALDGLVAARDSYRASGHAGWSNFKTAVDHFMDVYMNTLLKGQHSTMEMQKKVFDDAAWDYVSNQSQDSHIIEATLFAGVQRYAPEGADPTSFKSARPVS